MQFLILGPLEVTDDGRKLALGGPETARRARAPDPAREPRRPGGPADRRPLGRGAARERPQHAPDLRLPAPQGARRRSGSRAATAGTCSPPPPGRSTPRGSKSLVKRGKAQAGSDPGAAAATLSDALSLWRADALADVTEEPSLRGEAARLEELRLSATEHRVSAEIAMGGHSTVVPELESLTARYPLRERMWANLMLALYRSGRQAEALVDVRARPPGAGRRARRGSLARAAAAARADPADGRPSCGAPATRRRATERQRSARAASTCSRAPRSPATASNAPWGGAA